MDKSSQKKSYARNITSREEASTYSQVNSFLPLTCTQHSQKRSSGFKANRVNRAFGYFLQVSLLRRTDEPQYRVPNSCGRLQPHSVWVPALFPVVLGDFGCDVTCQACWGAGVVFIACKDIFYVTSHADKLSTIRFADLCSTY